MIVAVTLHTSQRTPQRDMTRTTYVPYLQALGLTPVLLPNNLADVGAYLDALHIGGIVLSGGGDLDPARYGAANTASVDIAPERDRTEWALLDAALARDLPVLGICRGMQVLNAYCGGGLVQDIPSAIASPTEHGAEGSLHWLDITAARLAAVLGAERIEVNSHHHQGVTRDVLAPGFDVFAVSPADGIIEGMIHREHAILAVQWHPERSSHPIEDDRTLFKRLFAEGAFWRKELV